MTVLNFFRELYALMHTSGAYAVWSGTATHGQAHVLYGGSAIQSFLYWCQHQWLQWGTINTLKAALGG